mmetsp:Transcript_3479/g.7318  ORF Transcript_3479/g.7318 Transcript_3479/m.7318 type:complete len:103 (+) Transcript_3479:551-859(+)
MRAIRSVLPEVEDDPADTPYHMTLGQCGNRASAAEFEQGLQREEWVWSVTSVALLSQKNKGKFATLEVLPLAEGGGDEARSAADGSSAAESRGTGGSFRAKF